MTGETIKEAARKAEVAGAESEEAPHLPAEAGLQRGAQSAPEVSAEGAVSVDADASAGQRAGNAEPPSRETVEAALTAQDGNISRAARALGVHRTQLRSWMERYELD